MPLVKFISSKWKKYGNIFIAGDLTLEQGKLLLTKNCDDIFSYLLENDVTHFGLVKAEENNLRIITDPVSSYPVLVKINPNNIYVTDNIETFKNTTKTRNQIALKSILHAGYCLGTDTIIPGVKWISPFSIIEINQNKFSEKYYYQNYKLKNKINYKKIENKIVEICAEKISESVTLPLSAGYDSKFLGRILKNSKINLNTLSYGPKKAWDVEGGKVAAKIIGASWIHYNYRRRQHKQFCKTFIFEKLKSFSNTGVSMFYYQDAKIISTNTSKILNSTLINGNTGDFISGGHLKEKTNNSGDLSLEKQIYENIYKLWMKTGFDNDLLEYIEKEIQRLKIKYNPSSELELKYFFELENRQSKYVLSGQRIYDFFNLNWSLPFWWPVFLFPHLNVDKKYIINQALFEKYLIKNDFDYLFNAKIYSKRHSRYFIVKVLRKLFKILKYVVPSVSKWENTIFIPFFSTLHQTASYNLIQRIQMPPIKKETAYWAKVYVDENC
ncbi:hypothetical protein OAB14_01610 [Amylibacter sp.]|nr:hypothetical protein [Amylibacter sp.]MDC1252933.1 hypothetical protein [Amylibacter sp.]